MTSLENPWASMGVSSQRRVVADSPHDVFWITDHMGRYGFLIVTKDSVLKTENSLSLKGITVIKTTVEKNMNELFLVLNNSEDWSIFSTLCRDLTEVIIRHDDHRMMINAIENQLKRWQRLLQQQPSSFTVEQQMGLFTELICLKEIVMKKTLSITDALTSWVGPEFDKQDFLMSDAVIEVKSHRTSRGEVVSISSAHQLHCDKEPFYLVSYGLTLTDSGLSVREISDEIKQLCTSEELKALFEIKLFKYGYIPEFVNGPLQRFTIDNVKVFKITKDFPRIIPTELKSQIFSVKYMVDLSQCSQFELDYHQFMKGM